MTAILCALLTAVGYYFSIGLGEQWWLAWLAPIPVLWFAFGDTRGWLAFVAAWAGYALGSTSVLRAYGGIMPIPITLLSLMGPSLLFASAVMCARRVQRALGAVPAMLAFAAVWAAFDFFVSFNRAGGTVSSPSAAEIGAPLLIQTASLVGFTGITFVMGFVTAGIALTLRMRAALPATLAVIAFAANAGFGYIRMSAPPDGHIRVGLIDSDTRTSVLRDDPNATLSVVDAYAGEMSKLKDVNLIVLPENMARVIPAAHDAVTARLVAESNKTHATVVAGFNDVTGSERHNVAYATSGDETARYVKRRLVLGVETPRYTPGTGGPLVMANGTGVEICKDMDFASMVRADEVATHPRLLAVPAWDFGKDGWSHGRIAILRAVENGVPMARTAREGLLMLVDRYGRVLGMRETGADFVSLTGDLPLDGTGGNTVYDRIGDLFGWLCAALGLGLVAASFFRLWRTRSA